MVVHSDYPADARVRRETEALIEAGWSVDVVCLRRPGERPFERCGGARVHRLPISRHRTGGMGVYLAETAAFFALAALRVAQLHRWRPFDVVQAHNMPDYLVFVGLLPKLVDGARVVLDVHDPMPELFATRAGRGGDHPLVRLVGWMEQRSAAFADHVLTVGEPSRRSLLGRGLPPEKLTVVVNSADPRIFRPRPAEDPKAPGEFRLVYHGGLFERYGLDLAVRAVDRLRDRIPGLTFRIYGEGEAADGLRRQVDELGLADRVRLGGFVPIDRVPGLVAGADLGVVPYRRTDFTDLIYPSKAFEYYALDIPVVMSRLTGMVALFGEIPDLFVEPGDVEALADRILALERDRARLARLLEASRRAYQPYSWAAQRQRYVDLMERLASADRPRAVAGPV